MASITKILSGVGMAAAYADRYYGGGQAKILWVCNRSGVPAGDGSSPDYPLSTLGGSAGALARLNATTSQGHVIFLMGGHAESVSAADYFSHTGAANAFAICGLGGPTTGPRLTWTVAGSTWLVDTADVAIDGVNMFWAGAHAAGSALTVAAPMTVSAAGFQMRNCKVKCGFDADQIVTVGLTIGAADAVIENNEIIGLTAAEITATGTVIRLTAADRCVIRNNYISAALATDTDGLIETLTTASKDIRITDNELYSNGAGSTCAIDFGADLVCTGTLRRNLMTVDADGTAETVVFTRHANNNLTLLDNFLVNNNNERGLVIGTASA